MHTHTHTLPLTMPRTPMLALILTRNPNPVGAALHVVVAARAPFSVPEVQAFQQDVQQRVNPSLHPPRSILWREVFMEPPLRLAFFFLSSRLRGKVVVGVQLAICAHATRIFMGLKAI